MVDAIKIELVTPSKMLFSDSAEMAVIPGSEGEFGVLPRHAPTLANLQRGTLNIYDNGTVTRRFLIDGGVADVLPERVIVLAERAVDLDAVSTKHLDEQLLNATEAEAAFVKAIKEAV